MAEITITQALSTLKVLEKRYKANLSVGRRSLSGTGSVTLVAVKHGANLKAPYSSYKEDDFIERAKASMQSVEDLYKRIITIKNAIAVSNATTMVKIGGKEMTVQEAIIQKQYSELRKLKLDAYKEELRRARETYQEALDDNQRRVDDLMKNDSSDSNKNRDNIAKVIEDTWGVSLVDPCDLQNKISELEQEIEDFESNVDFILSESNATTRIYIPD